MSRRPARLCLALALLAAITAFGSGCSKGTNTEIADEGDEIFRTGCARCHGTLGTGGPPDPLGNPGPRNFTERRFQEGITDAQIRSTIESGRRGMPAFGAVFNRVQLDKLVVRIRAFGPAPPAPTAASAP